MKKCLPKRDSIPVPSAYEAKSLSVLLLDQITSEELNVDDVLNEFAIYVNLYHVVDVAKRLFV